MNNIILKCQIFVDCTTGTSLQVDFLVSGGSLSHAKYHTKFDCTPVRKNTDFIAFVLPLTFEKYTSHLNLKDCFQQSNPISSGIKFSSC